MLVKNKLLYKIEQWKEEVSQPDRSIKDQIVKQEVDTTSIEACVEHSDVQEFFCEDWSKPICKQWITSPSHLRHVFVTIQKINQLKSREIKSAKDSLEKTLSIWEEDIQNMKEYSSNLSNSALKLVTSLKHQISLKLDEYIQNIQKSNPLFEKILAQKSEEQIRLKNLEAELSSIGEWQVSKETLTSLKDWISTVATQPLAGTLLWGSECQIVSGSYKFILMAHSSSKPSQITKLSIIPLVMNEAWTFKLIVEGKQVAAGQISDADMQVDVDVHLDIPHHGAKVQIHVDAVHDQSLLKNIQGVVSKLLQ